jgi:pimeloyl-ACP methyl ester carboxylesterase
MEERLQIILNHLGEAPALLVGSSFGGLAAALVHQRRPDLVLGVVLCAPAFQRPEAVELTGLGEIPAVIIHGTGDTVVPLEASQKFASSHSVRLIEVEGGHRLHSAIDLIVEMVGEVQSCIKQA